MGADILSLVHVQNATINMNQHAPLVFAHVQTICPAPFRKPLHWMTQLKLYRAAETRHIPWT